ncbi:hypothetical protein ACH5RR_039922 [Cinchona calisaya]|uniref:PGG domain-containing protein n=1 Tax=Cinchona calisaya TaxID=153742 RepID=A0ABD2Y376_9GENT
MVKRLYDAALEGDVTTFNQLLEKDSLLLDKSILNCEDKNPLHLATIMGNVDFIKAIFLHLNNDNSNDSSTRDYMCLAGDRDGRNPLHLAAIFGKLEVLQVLIRIGDQLAFQMCLACDRDGRNALHLAAMHGKLEVLQVLIDNEAVHHMRLACDRDGRNTLHFPAVRQKTDGGGTILHLCVKYNQLEALKLIIDRIKDRAFVNAKNEDGRTILHLAIYYGNKEAIMYIVKRSKIRMNIRDANRKTGLDFLLGQDNIDPKVKSSLETHGALPGTEVFFIQEWIENRRNAIMVVASLIATMAFQAGISPPGGVWQDDLVDGPNPHRAGEAVMAQTHPKYYRALIAANTIAFVSSLNTITLLIRGSSISSIYFICILASAMLVATATTTITYATSLVAVAPKDARWQLSDASLIQQIVISVWLGLMVTVVYDIIFVCVRFKMWRKYFGRRQVRRRADAEIVT